MIFWHGVIASSMIHETGDLNWSDVYSQSMPGTNGDWIGYNVRMVIPSTMLPPSGQQIRLTLQGNPSSDTEIYDMRIGFAAASGNRWDFASTPIRVRFTNALIRKIPANTDLVSDPIDMPFDGTKNLVIALRGNGVFPVTTMSSPPITGHYSTGANTSGDLAPPMSITMAYNILTRKMEWSGDAYVAPVFPAGHPMWRAQWLTAGNANYISIAEMDFKNVAGGASLVDGGVPIESGHYSLQVPSFAYDGNTGTYWESSSVALSSGNNWLGYAFKENVAVNSISVTSATPNPNERPLTGKVQWSDDGITWTDHFNFSFAAWGTAPETQVASAPAPLGRWRLLVDDKNDPTYGQFAVLGEINFREVFGTDSLMNGALSASSVYTTGYEPNKATDGNDSTYWATLADQWSGAWWRMDTAENRDVTELRLKSPNNSLTISRQMPRSFRLQVSPDGTTWIDRLKVIDETTWGQNITRRFKVPPATVGWVAPADPGAHRYWSLLVREPAAGNTFGGISELEFRATVGGADMTVPGGPISSTSVSSGTAANMVDNNNVSRLQWGGDNVRVAYDFTTPVSVAEIGIIPNSDLVTRGPGYFTVDYSDDGVTWTSVCRCRVTGAEYTALPADTFLNINLTRPTDYNARYWGLFDLTSNSAMALANIELATSSSGADVTNPGDAVWTNNIYGSSYDIPYAFDDVPSTFWATGITSGGRVGVDLGSGDSAAVSHLRFQARPDTPDQGVTNGNVYFSDDGNVYWYRGSFTTDWQTNSPQPTREVALTYTP